MPSWPVCASPVSCSSSSSRWLCCAGVLVLLFSLGGFVAVTDELNELVEHRLVKNGTLHAFFQTSANATWVPASSSLILFQHIPRTAGDSMQTHLFNAVDLQWGPFGFRDENAPPSPGYLVSHVDLVARARVAKGYFSTPEIHRVMQWRNVTSFTFLRDPVERALSMKELNLRRFSVEEVFNRSSLFHRIPRNHLIASSYLENAMTWQLAGNLHSGHRFLSPETALARAKARLREMAFIGFYEDLAVDFQALRRTVFPHVEVPWYFPAFFVLGTWVSLPRLRVRKYAARLSESERALVRPWLDLDLELYDFARQLAGKDFAMFDSYDAWVAAHWWLLLAIALGPPLALYLCVFLLRRLGRGWDAWRARRRVPRRSSLARSQDGLESRSPTPHENDRWSSDRGSSAADVVLGRRSVEEEEDVEAGEEDPLVR